MLISERLALHIRNQSLWVSIIYTQRWPTDKTICKSHQRVYSSLCLGNFEGSDMVFLTYRKCQGRLSEVEESKRLLLMPKDICWRELGLSEYDRKMRLHSSPSKSQLSIATPTSAPTKVYMWSQVKGVFLDAISPSFTFAYWSQRSS